MEEIIALYKDMLHRTDTSFVRYLHDKIDWKARMLGIVGARGVGKTTLLLQHIKLRLDTEKTIYADAGNIYFAENRLFDFAQSFYKNGGKHLFIDEIHKYADWSKELKMCYDYFPDMQIIFTGSSVLDIYRGSDDLSRRALSYFMAGMSFREYLIMAHKIKAPVYSLKEILANKVSLPADHPLPMYKQYLKKGYYPFFTEAQYEQRLQNVIRVCSHYYAHALLGFLRKFWFFCDKDTGRICEAKKAKFTKKLPQPLWGLVKTIPTALLRLLSIGTAIASSPRLAFGLVLTKRMRVIV